jgi:hypothetical protein
MKEKIKLSLEEINSLQKKYNLDLKEILSICLSN